jgi:hypothetical protein
MNSPFLHRFIRRSTREPVPGVKWIGRLRLSFDTPAIRTSHAELNPFQAAN